MYYYNNPYKLLMVNNIEMYSIKFDREIKGIEDSLFGIAVEKTIKENVTFVGLFKQRGSLADLGDGVLGLDSELYELKGQGAILYQKFVAILGYHAKVLLIGFDEEKNEAYKILKGKLEELLMTDDIEVIKSKFLEKRS